MMEFGRKRKVKCLLAYPQAMRADLDKKGVPPWSEGGSFDSFGSALDYARKLAEQKNFPIEVTCMGRRMTVYPKSIGY